MPLSRELHFIRSNKTKFGGAERYLSRLTEALKKQNIDFQIVNSIFPKFLPSWLRVILFNFQVCLFKNDKFYFSLDRITCPDIYRAGDGVHKVFLDIKKKSKLNLLHPIYLFLEKRCFKNAKCIIANSLMVKEQIINCYDINPDKVRVIFSGIESKEIYYQKAFEKLSKQYLINKDQFILLYVGSGFKRKGVKEFLEILSRLDKNNIMAFVIGKEKNINYYQKLAKELDLPLVATNDAHYHIPERHKLQSALVAIKSNETIDNAMNNLKVNGEYYLKSSQTVNVNWKL